MCATKQSDLSFSVSYARMAVKWIYVVVVRAPNAYMLFYKYGFKGTFVFHMCTHVLNLAIRPYMMPFPLLILDVRVGLRVCLFVAQINILQARVANDTGGIGINSLMGIV